MLADPAETIAGVDSHQVCAQCGGRYVDAHICPAATAISVTAMAIGPDAMLAPGDSPAAAPGRLDSEEREEYRLRAAWLAENLVLLSTALVAVGRFPRMDRVAARVDVIIVGAHDLQESIAWHEHPERDRRKQQTVGGPRRRIRDAGSGDSPGQTQTAGRG